MQISNVIMDFWSGDDWAWENGGSYVPVRSLFPIIQCHVRKSFSFSCSLLRIVNLIEYRPVFMWTHIADKGQMYLFCLFFNLNKPMHYGFFIFLIDKAA